MKRALIAALLAALVVAPAAAACPKTSVGDLEDEVQCLECGVPLQLATESAHANRKRARIGRMVDSCASKQEIKDRLVAEFGPRVLTTPDDEGFDLTAWVIPIVALLAGAMAIGLTARRWRRGRKPPPEAAPAADGGRLDADIERYDL